MSYELGADALFPGVAVLVESAGPPLLFAALVSFERLGFLLLLWQAVNAIVVIIKNRKICFFMVMLWFNGY